MNQFTVEKYTKALNTHGLLVASPQQPEILGSPVQKVSYNSKDVTPGTLFVCKGNRFKEEYLDMAIEGGVMAYVSEKEYHKSIPCILVNDIQKSLSLISNIYYDYPWKKLKLIGITGTKGKSTTAYYIKYILDEYLLSQGKKETGIISSIDTFDGIIKEESHITTPESLDLQMHFHNAVTSGLEYLVMETSSQAFKYGRLYDVRFDVGIFLNISEDHISPIEHADLEDYFTSKLKLFNQTDIACVNLETDFADRVVEASKAAGRVLTFGMRDQADYYGYNIHKEGFDTVFDVKCKNFEKRFKLTMPGLFNVENALAAISAMHVLGIPESCIYTGLEKARSSGRMEIYTNKNHERIVIVDYAHNKLSFEKLYESTKAEYPDRKIITVFGCPGGKAFLRRRDLGLLSGLNSDKIYLTAEDPAEESVYSICEDIAQYVKQHNDNYEIVEDRGEAIRKSIIEAEPNTIVLLTGKGNETRQKIGKEYIPCPSDVDYVKQYLNEYDKIAAEAAVTLEADK